MQDDPQKPAGTEKRLKDVPKPRHRKRSFNLDKQRVVDYVLGRLQIDLDARQGWNQKRIDRYAKLRGWLPTKGSPLGSQSSNVWMPIMLVASMRLKASLENATKSMRPLMSAKALQQRNMDKQDSINRLTDYQFFTEAMGERVLDDFISNLVDDGLAIAHTRWVRRDEVIHDVRGLPGVADQIPIDFQIYTALKSFFPTMIDALPIGTSDYSWKVFYQAEEEAEGPTREALVEFYDTEDGRIEAHVAKRVRAYDGPAVEVHDLEDIVVPVRSANLQPPSPENPHGALYVNRVCKTTVDEIKRKMKDGTYDLMTDEDLAKIENSGGWQVNSQRTGDPEEAKQVKDSEEGQDIAWGSHQDIGQRVIVEWYGRWDVDGDGLEENVIFWVARESKVLLRARYLTELYPGVPIKRPFAEARLFSVSNRFYAMSLGEILEPVQDMIKGIMDQNFDWGLITNIPFFFFRPSSGMRQEEMKLEPGTGYPLDRPQEDVFFPTWNRDMSWTINTLTILQQYAERLSMQSDVQFGRVPTGKASALRTTGTTAALLQQGDVRSEQILRRLFQGFAEIFQMMHRLNRRYLPPMKELRIIGLSEPGAEPYAVVTPDKIDADIDFEFNATLLNSNKQIVAQSLQEIMMMTVSPIAIQLGLVQPEQIYKLMRDSIKARDLDPDAYLTRPPGEVLGPKYTAEDILSMILAGEQPSLGSGPLEQPQEHLQKLQTFSQSNEFGYFNPEQVKVLQGWMQMVMLRMQEQMRMQQLMMAASKSQKQNGGGEEGPGGVESEMNPDTGANPPVSEGETQMPTEQGVNA
mgnify:CR=1 FL=1